MSDIPDGADAKVARMAIAWEMTKKIEAGTGLAGSNDDKIKFYLTVYNELYGGLKEAEKVPSARAR